MRQLQKAGEQLQQNFQAIQKSATNAGTGVAKFGRDLEQNTRRLRDQATTVQGLIGAYAGFRTLRGAITAGVELESAEKRAQLLTQRFSQLAGIQQVAAQSADKFRLAQTDTLSSLIDLGNRLGPQGATINEIRDVYEGFNTVLAINKVSTTEATAAQLQLNQALGAGRLQGDEFRSVNEATPQVIDEIAKVLKIARGEVKEFAAEGKVTAPVLVQALRNIKEQGADVLEQSFDTAGGRLRAFQKAQTELAQAIGTDLLPAFTPLLEDVTNLIQGFSELPKPIRQFTAGIAALTATLVILTPALTGAIGLIKAIGLATIVAAGPWVALAAGITAATFALANYQTQSQRTTTAVATKAATGDAGAIVDARKRLDNVLQEISLRTLAGTGRRGAAPGSSALNTLKKEALELKAAITQGETLGVAGAMPDGLTAKPSKEDGKDKKKKTRKSELADIEAANGLFRAQSAIQERIFTATQKQNTAETLRLEHIDRSVQLLFEYDKILRDSTIPADEKLAATRGIQDKLAQSNVQYAQDLIKAANEQIAPLDEIVKATKQNSEDNREILRLQAEGISPELAKQYISIERAAKLEQERLPVLIAAAEAALEKAKADGKDVTKLEEGLQALRERLGLLPQIVSGAKQVAAATEADAKAQAAAAAAAAQLKQVYADIGMSIKDGVVGAIQGAIDGTKTLQDVASNLLQNISNKLLDIAVNMALFGTLSGTGTGGGLLGALFKPSPQAKGGAFGSNGIIPFAKGGVVSAPTLFPFANGIGLMGEAGPEAIMPLKRGSNGKLGVEASGSGATNIVINVDATGSSVQGNQAEGKALAAAIGAAVQSELIKQKKPGGLLY